MNKMYYAADEENGLYAYSDGETITLLYDDKWLEILGKQDDAESKAGKKTRKRTSKKSGKKTDK